MKTARIRLLPPHARWLGPAPALGRLIRVSSRGWSATPGSRITAASGWPCCDWAISLARHIFGLSWPATIRCLWLVLRTTQLWAPFPNNNADRARRLTERFYTLVKERYAEPFDPAIAATLELAWWRVHRESQHSALAAMSSRSSMRWRGCIPMCTAYRSLRCVELGTTTGGRARAAIWAAR